MGVVLKVIETDGNVVNLSTPSNVVQVTSSPVSIKTVVNTTQPLVTLKSIAGLPGLSAYEVAVKRGFVGTELDWIASLEGPPGPPGATGTIDLSSYYTMSDIDYLINSRAIPTGAITQYYRGDLTWATLDKSAVGLSNVDNTADVNKPISSATQTALNAKAIDSAVVHLAEAETISGVKTFSASPIVPTPTLDTQAATKAYVDTKVGTGTGGGTWGSITGTLANQTDLNTALSGKEASIVIGTTAQYWRGDKTWQTLNKAAVGLANVDNTADVSKPVSTAQQTALNAKENTITAGLTTQYWRGDKAWVTLDKTAVGLANVDNTSDASKPISTAQQTALNAKENTIAAGTTAQYYRGDKTWQTLNKAAVGLSNVDNTSDSTKLANVPRVIVFDTAWAARTTVTSSLTDVVFWVGGTTSPPGMVDNRDVWLGRG